MDLALGAPAGAIERDEPHGGAGGRRHAQREEPFRVRGERPAVCEERGQAERGVDAADDLHGAARAGHRRKQRAAGREQIGADELERRARRADEVGRAHGGDLGARRFGGLELAQQAPVTILRRLEVGDPGPARDHRGLRHRDGRRRGRRFPGPLPFRGGPGLGHPPFGRGELGTRRGEIAGDRFCFAARSRRLGAGPGELFAQGVDLALGVEVDLAVEAGRPTVPGERDRRVRGDPEPLLVERAEVPLPAPAPRLGRLPVPGGGQREVGRPPHPLLVDLADVVHRLGVPRFGLRLPGLERPGVVLQILAPFAAPHPALVNARPHHLAGGLDLVVPAEAPHLAGEEAVHDEQILRMPHLSRRGCGGRRRHHAARHGHDHEGSEQSPRETSGSPLTAHRPPPSAWVFLDPSYAPKAVTASCSCGPEPGWRLPLPSRHQGEAADRRRSGDQAIRRTGPAQPSSSAWSSPGVAMAPRRRTSSPCALPLRVSSRLKAARGS
ncbi:MAG: hypothetical protein BWX64_02677 [Acidobacteria bacterium ADurb.Bin051]|nr:MAG: hypothetical protein BWX64_02677 [Acidobacteria bacterium ADurb.Bin051]